MLPPNPTESLTQPPHSFADEVIIRSLEHATVNGFDLLQGACSVVVVVFWVV
jgi:hypothetical protein